MGLAYRILPSRSSHLRHASRRGRESKSCARSYSSSFSCSALTLLRYSQDPNSTYHHIHRLLARHREHIRDDPWAGLPELTNAEGARCPDSCETQASSNCLIGPSLANCPIPPGLVNFDHPRRPRRHRSRSKVDVEEETDCRYWKNLLYMGLALPVRLGTSEGSSAKSCERSFGTKILAMGLGLAQRYFVNLVSSMQQECASEYAGFEQRWAAKDLRVRTRRCAELQ